MEHPMHCLIEPKWAKIIARTKGLEALAKRIADDEQALEDEAGTIQQAREEYASDECEIDDNPLTSRGDAGCWVSAWVWVCDGEDE